MFFELQQNRYRLWKTGDAFMSIDMNKIRDYQKKAVKTVMKYINDDITEEGCLISLPTGTGKTGVMTYVVNYFSDKNFLIVVPNATLPEQIKKEINTDFWQKINYSPSNPSVAKLYNQDDESTEANTIIITIQKLLYINKNNSDAFQKLSDWTDVIFYDEGHHEPSQEWAEASRNIQAKTVLFTATPFRNDYRYFNVSKSFFYEYFIKAAMDDKHIKYPVFYKIPSDVLLDSNKIANFITKKTRNKSIARISSTGKIETIKKHFESQLQVACCHSKFTVKKDYYNNGQSFKKNQNNYKIVLQTDMLSEGVDIPDFTDLFLIDCYDNFKSFAQIVGRVLRKNEFSDEANIYIPEDVFDFFTEQWKLYCERAPKTKYYNGKFLEEFSLDDTENIYEEILYEKQSSIYYSTEEGMLDKLKQSIIKKIRSTVEIESNTIKEKLIAISNVNLYTACYTVLIPSSHLIKKLSYDKHFEYISLVEIKTGDTFYYFYYSSQRLYPFEDISNISNISMNNLYCLLPQNADVKNVSFRSSNINQIGVSNFSYMGNSLNVLPSSTEQRMSFFKNALATYDSKHGTVNRYISNFSSKVSDRNQRCDYCHFIEWCNSLLEEIKHEEKNSYFERFAPITNEPDEEIAYIAFDEMNSNFDFVECDVFRNLYPVESNRFIVKSDSGEEITGCIDSVDDIKYIQFDSTGISETFYNKNINIFHQTIKKGFVLYYIKSAVMYSNGNYYKPNIKYTYEVAEQCELLNIITPLSSLMNCEDEKTGKITKSKFNASGFPINSVFGAIVEELKSSKYSFDYIVCDDLQCEIADFIAIDSKAPKICFIHCKYGESDLSASAFHDVCGQAIKNLNYVISADISHTDFIENHFHKWQSPWKNDGYKTSRKISGDIFQLIEVYKKIIKDSDIKKEVWIVTSGLSKESLRKELVKKKQQEQYIPLMNILHYTQDNIVKAGATLKIFCKN